MSDLVATIGCSPETLLSDYTVTISSAGCESAFLFHHLVALYLKRGQKVCLVSYMQAPRHYSTVANKLGVNADMLQKKGSLVIVDGLSAIGKGLIDNIDCDAKNANNGSSNKLSTLFPLQTYYEGIKTSIQTLISSSTDDKVLLAVDDVAIFVELGYSVAEVTMFCQYVMNIVSSTSKQRAAVLFGVRTVQEDADLIYLNNYLCHQSDLHLLVSRLDSGYSTDVQGKVEC